nr:hypothetical protein [Tanacetum cinerariifolium]
GGNWEWRLPPRGRALDDIASLISIIGNLTLSSNEAALKSWSWSMDSSRKLKVKTLSRIIQNITLSDSIIDEHHVWNSWVPRKVNIASLNRLATRMNLVSRERSFMVFFNALYGLYRSGEIKFSALLWIGLKLPKMMIYSVHPTDFEDVDFGSMLSKAFIVELLDLRPL